MKSNPRLIGLFAALLLLGTTREAAAAQRHELRIASGQSVVLNAPGLRRAAVGDGHIASVVPVGNEQAVLSGKAPGRTSVILWTTSGQSFYAVTVTEQSLDVVTSMLRAVITEPNVSVMTFDHAIVVRGSVADTAHFAALTEVLSRFDKYEAAKKYNVINAVTVVHPFGAIQDAIDRIANNSSVRLDPDAKGNIIVSGHVANRTQAEAILAQARGIAGPYLPSDGKVIDRLQSAATSQIRVKVQILEVDENGLKQLGVRLQSGTGNPLNNVANPGERDLGSPAFPIFENPGKGIGIGSFYRTIALVPTIDLLISNGDAKIMSDPTLTTMPGMEANFLVGGEIPIPFASGIGQISILYKDFGVRLKINPTILGSGSVNTVIESEVSSLDFADGIQISGFSIPALKTSKLATDVVTASGESIVMGGLLQHVETRTIQKIPLLGDLPVLGQLFRST
ncbi:MAG: pilus assembly protein N-terminal domain-containing protein, partial [Candidatus Eremiobacteraeota bacterium]|nr:pilus assembly protein N-terminal domain-containing protein [Candidatus Eremiobacteraeota bacterium]